ncbi:MAG: methylated-DNA--[protein]-cysteine S-methyltransferase [Rikenellaceae bacterium]
MGSLTHVKVDLKPLSLGDHLLPEVVKYSFMPTPFGKQMFLASLPEGVVFLGFGASALCEAQKELPEATFVREKCRWAGLMESYFRCGSIEVSVLIRASNFKLDVLKTLINAAPVGKVITYADLAKAAGKPKAVRAVASVLARNPVSLLIPCHRVQRKDGSIGRYRWGGDIKNALIEYEKNSFLTRQ